MITDQSYDVVIIGGGVVGCATLFHLTNNGYNCLMLEKNKHLVSEASAGNSGMLHTGFDAPLGSLELHCIQQCQLLIFDILNRLDLPYNRLGATMVAWDSVQMLKLPIIIQHSMVANVSQVNQLSLSQLYQREPNLSRNAAGAIHIPGETIVDPWLTPIVMAEHARIRGAKIYTSTLVNNVEFNDSNRTWNVYTNKGNVGSKTVINCSGLYGDIVEKIAGYSSFKIKPRKGQYLIFSKTAKDVISSSILPVPTEITKGVIVFKSVYDNVIIGPTAEETEDRHASPTIDSSITTRLRNYGKKTVPSLSKHDIVHMYTGVRPATENKDYQIIARLDRNWLTVGGIRSTGLSGCIGIADHILSQVKDKFGIEPSKSCWETIHKVNFNFSKNGTAMFPHGIEHLITHPLTFTGVTRQTISQSNL
ncbi:glycerol 3-phosphate dehydrogenase-like [Mytilus californianus]|uniref:glycerol 3-phosphate dehydrogenase-like n=1 Tax=Mytilus californianus TaxID=6549 RepID=UPI0022468BEF|nr:glycerol 3-phosphate dehydrogenase-like [Mytilus californianus]